ncbi:MAG: hypothetical protein WCH43_13430 [Verrucomicrobiota bacterium]
MKPTMPRKSYSFLASVAATSFCVATLLISTAENTGAAVVQTKVVKSGNGFQLQRDGKPYFIKGDGGDGPKDLLVKCGGNSFRTWGFGPDIMTVLLSKPASIPCAK